MTLLPFLHFFCFLVYIFLAGFILYKDSRAVLNRICSALLLCFSLWSFCYIFVQSPYTAKDTARLFWKISSIAWISICALFLWFSLVLTQRVRALSSTLFYIIMFSLPLLLIYNFWTGSFIHSIKKPYGWLAVIQMNIWKIIFYIYYLSYMVSAFSIIFLFIKKASDEIRRKQAKILLVFSIITLILGSIISVILPEMGIYTLPPIADIVNLVWTFGLVYALIKYRLFIFTPYSAAENIIETMPDALFLINNECRIATVNSATLNLFGYSEDEILGKSFLSLFEDKLFKGLKKQEIIQGLICNDLETVFNTKNGKNIFLHLSCTEMHDSGGIAAGIVCIARDITEKNIIDEELKESEARYRLLIESAPAGIIYIDREGNIINTNPRLIEILGSPSAKETAKINMLTYPPLIEAGISTDIKNCLEKGEGGVFERPYKTKWGKQVYLRFNLTPIKNSKGQITSVLAIVEDITERIRAEGRVLKQSILIVNILESITQPIYVINLPDYNVLLSNLAAQKSNSQEKTCYELLYHRKTPCNGEDMACPLKEVLRTKQSAVCERVHCDRDGNEKYYEIHGYPIFDNGNVDQLILNTLDITERKQAEEKIKASLQQKELLLSEIHHRVKNNLQIISSLLGLQSGHIKDEQLLQIFRDSQNRVSTMALIHEKLYRSEDFSRIRFDEYIMDLSADLFRVFNVDTGRIKLNIIENDLSLKIDQAIPCALLLNELISNSLKHAFPPGWNGKGEIRISLTRKDAGNIELIVNDNGIGLPDDIDFRRTKSLGMELITVLSEKQLKGSIDLSRNSGTAYTIIFPENGPLTQ